MSRSLNGTTQYLSGNIGAAPFPNSTFMSAWFYPKSYQDGVVFSVYQSVGGPAYYRGNYILMYAADGKVSFVSEYNAFGVTNAAEAKSGNAVTLNAWNHAIGVMYAADDRRIILNGGTQATNATSITTGTYASVAIGAHRDTGGIPFHGDIAECSAWDIDAVSSPADEVAWAKGLYLGAGYGYGALHYRRDRLKLHYPLLGNERSWTLYDANLAAIGSPSFGPHPRIIMPGTVAGVARRRSLIDRRITRGIGRGIARGVG